VLAQNYYVKFTPIDKNTTRIEAEGYVDPGGVTPHTRQLKEKRYLKTAR
jgi:hypothetical protein